MRVAFYAPMKPVDHPVPSGERKMARLLIAGLEMAGHHVEVASTLRSHAHQPHDGDLFRAAENEISRLRERFQDNPPDLWFCYHPYYKAPDLIGPTIAEHFNMTLVTAEASLAGKRDRDGWQYSQHLVRGMLAKAQCNFSFTPGDRPGLHSVIRPGSLVDLPPFIDPGPNDAPPHGARQSVHLITAAMMRSGVKLASYQALAAALQHCADLDWHLTIIGDGPARENVQAAFKDITPARLNWAGQLSASNLNHALGQADLFVWPGIGEAYGLVYLEAAAQGVPAVAYDGHGVPSVVRHNETGLLVPTGDVNAYANTLRQLISDASLRGKLGEQAALFVRGERNVVKAAKILDQGLQMARKHHG